MCARACAPLCRCMCALSIPPRGSWAGRLSGWSCRPPTCWCTPACGSRLCLPWKRSRGGRERESQDEGQCENWRTSGTVRNPLALTAKWDRVWKVCIGTAAIWPQRSAIMEKAMASLREWTCSFFVSFFFFKQNFFSMKQPGESGWCQRHVARWSHHFLIRDWLKLTFPSTSGTPDPTSPRS